MSAGDLVRAGILSVAAVAAYSEADAAVLASYQFGVAGQETTVETGTAYAPTATLAGVSATAVSDPAGTIGIEISSAGPTPVGAPFLRVDPQGNSSAAATAVQNNKYFQFTVSAEPGNLLTVTGLDFLAARGGAGTPRGYAVRSSADNFAADIATAALATVRPTWTTVSLPLAGTGFSDLPAGTPLTFRIYPYSPAAGSSVDFDSIAIQGVVPEPTVVGMLVFSGAAVLMRRRRA